MMKASQRSYEAMGVEHHFDSDFKFKLKENDPVTGDHPTTHILHTYYTPTPLVDTANNHYQNAKHFHIVYSMGYYCITI
jgi:hypothetical protein